MLQNTFIHLPKSGSKTEKKIWEKGIKSWDDIYTKDISETLGEQKFHALRDYIDKSKIKLKENDINFFAQHIPPTEYWRLFPEFREYTAYIDIETTGLGHGDYITTLSLYANGKARYYVHNRNMNDFISDVAQFKILVSYNGKIFDIPFIEKELGIKLPQIQIDLRYVLKSLGYTGGLKGCEKKLGISRGELDGVDGYFAVLLWGNYIRTHNPKALDTLIAYNMEDTVNLEKLMVIAYNKKIQQYPSLSINTIDENIPDVLIDKKADPVIIEELKQRLSYRYRK